MSISFDTYSLRARVFRVYLTISPDILLLMALVPEGLKFQAGWITAEIF
jgi:hypothetical protein